MIARLHRGSFPALLIKIAIIFFPRVMTFEGRKVGVEREVVPSDGFLRHDTHTHTRWEEGGTPTQKWSLALIFFSHH